MAESRDPNRPEASNATRDDDLTRGRGDENITDQIDTADDEFDEVEDLDEDEEDMEESER
jgi:hypothetical protein